MTRQGDSSSVHCNCSRGRVATELVGRIKGIGGGCSRDDDYLRPADRPDLRIYEIVGAVRHFPAQGYRRPGCNARWICCETADRGRWAGGDISGSVNRALLDDLKVTCRNIFQKMWPTCPNMPSSFNCRSCRPIRGRRGRSPSCRFCRLFPR